jgi:hypothetical protein
MIWYRTANGLLLALFIVLSAVAQDRITGLASIIDGDTIEIHGPHSPLWHRCPRKQPAVYAIDR